MKTIMFIFSLVIAVPLMAQKDHEIKLEPTVLELPNRNFYIASIIDQRVNQEQLGTVQKGLGNRKVAANFPTEFVPYLNQTVAKMLPAVDGQQPLILQINELLISERTTFSSESADAEINVDFLNPENHLSYGNFTAETGNKGMDVTTGHGRRMMDVLTEVITKFAQSDWQNVELQEVAVVTGWEFKTPFPRALYESWTTLKANEPLEEEDFDLKFNSKSKFPHYFPQTKRGKKIKDVFVITNDEAVYLNVNTYNVGDYFVKSQSLGRYIYFEDKFANQSATVAFGLIGAAASLKHYAIILDTDTGIVTKLEDADMDELLAPFPDLMKSYKNSSQKAEDKQAAIEQLNQMLKI